MSKLPKNGYHIFVDEAGRKRMSAIVNGSEYALRDMPQTYQAYDVGFYDTTMKLMSVEKV